MSDHVVDRAAELRSKSQGTCAADYLDSLERLGGRRVVRLRIPEQISGDADTVLPRIQLDRLRRIEATKTDAVRGKSRASGLREVGPWNAAEYLPLHVLREVGMEAVDDDDFGLLRRIDHVVSERRKVRNHVKWTIRRYDDGRQAGAVRTCSRQLNRDVDRIRSRHGDATLDQERIRTKNGESVQTSWDLTDLEPASAVGARAPSPCIEENSETA